MSRILLCSIHPHRFAVYASLSCLLCYLLLRNGWHSISGVKAPTSVTNGVFSFMLYFLPARGHQFLLNMLINSKELNCFLLTSFYPESSQCDMLFTQSMRFPSRGTMWYSTIRQSSGYLMLLTVAISLYTGMYSLRIDHWDKKILAVTLPPYCVAFLHYAGHSIESYSLTSIIYL